MSGSDLPERRREILDAVAAVLDGITEAEPPPEGLPADLLEPGADLAGAVRALTAAAGEIAAQRRTQAALAETAAQQARALDELRCELARLREDRAEQVREARAEATAALLVAMLDTRDRLARAHADARSRLAALDGASGSGKRIPPDEGPETGGPLALMSLGGLLRRLREVLGPASPPAVAAAPAGREVLDAVVRGLGITLERLDTLLEEQGVREIHCLGLPFEPERMRATGATVDPHVPEGTVVEVERTGHERDGKVLRVAHVRVARSVPAAAPADPEDGARGTERQGGG